MFLPLLRRRGPTPGAWVAHEGVLHGGLPYLAVGQGPPLVVFSGFTAEHANPTGAARRFSLQHPSSWSTGVCLMAGRLNVQLAARACSSDRSGPVGSGAQPDEDVGHTAPLIMTIVLRAPWRPLRSVNRGNR
jgi:hypothetical protein